MSERRTSEVKFRCTPSFKAALQAAADAAGQSLTEYIESAVWAHQNAEKRAEAQKTFWGVSTVESAWGASSAEDAQSGGLTDFIYTNVVESRPLTHEELNRAIETIGQKDSGPIPIVSDEAVPPGVVVVASCTRNCRPWEFCACKAAG